MPCSYLLHKHQDILLRSFPLSGSDFSVHMNVALEFKAVPLIQSFNNDLGFSQKTR